MKQAMFDPTSETFAAFHARFASLFGRADTQRRTAQYVRGLLTQQGDRRNAENLAAVVAGATPRAFQRLLTEAPWDHGPVIAALQAFLGPLLNADDGVWMLKEIAFPKEGNHSVGVAQQSCGSSGRVRNCQIGLFLAYASSRGQALADGQLYLPRVWTDDEERRRAVDVPDIVTYQSKSDLELAMLRATREQGHLRSRWVSGGEAHGQDTSFRNRLDAAGWWYILEIPSTTIVCIPPAVATMPLFALRQRGRRRMIACAPRQQTIETLAAHLAPDAWQTQSVAADTATAQRYQAAVQRVWEHRAGECGPKYWLVLRRNRNGGDVTAYLSNAPASTAPETLGRVSAVDSCIQTKIKCQQAAIGLDEYEVRSWRGWHHHVTLSLLAGAFLLYQQVASRSGLGTARPAIAHVERRPSQCNDR